PKQGAIQRRPATYLRSSDEWKERPVRAGEQEEGHGTREGGAKRAIVACIAHADSNRASQAFSRHARDAALGWTPPCERCDRSRVAERVEPERSRNAECAGDESTQCRTHRPADVDTHAVRRDRRWQVGAWNEKGYDGLPRRGGERAADADREHEGQQRDVSLLAFMFTISVGSALTAPSWQSVVPLLVPRAD